MSAYRPKRRWRKTSGTLVAPVKYIKKFKKQTNNIMKETSTKLLIFTFFVLSVSVFGQNPQPTATPPVQDEEEIIRISSSLVQTDFIVLDKNGKQVRDLKQSDIEIFQDGKRQDISNFSYISSASNERPKFDKKAVPIPSVPGRSNAVGRVLTFVVDDGNCAATLGAVDASRTAIIKFVNEQMQPNDRVAIYQTRSGSNLLQQYTSNKDQLLRTAKKIRYFPPVFRCDQGDSEASRDDATRNPFGSTRGTFESESSAKARESDQNFNRNNQIIGTIGVLNFAVERLKSIPGRKIIFFLTDGLAIPFGTRAVDSLRGIVDNASRSSVIINAVDARGLFGPGGSAGDEVPVDISERLKRNSDAQDGIKYLSVETGGSYIINQNKIYLGIGEILDDQSGYYLIGYQPNDETFKNKDFHNIEVKVKNPDLKVVSRSGFYGVEDKPRRVTQKTADSPLYQAIVAPILENGIESRLTTLFYNDNEKGNFVRTLFYLSGQDLTLVDEPNGMIKLSLDVVAVTLDEKNKVVSEFNRTHTTRLPKAATATILQNGFVYSADIPIEKKGAYSFRIAVRDAVSKRIASASDFIEVPDAKKENFYMSNLITAEIGQNGIPIFPTEKDAKEALSPVLDSSNSAIRQYRTGDSLFYAYTVYNSKIDKAIKKPNITTQIRLYRDGNLLVEGKEKPVELDNQTNLARIYDKGSIRITAAVQVGEYILQIIVKDKLTNKISTQFIDFEVIN